MAEQLPVMILAAGRGERMRPLTDDRPKPLLDVAGKPLIVYHLERLAAEGFVNIVINLGYRGDQISECIGDGARFGLRVRYSQEDEQAYETGGGICHALPLLGDGPFMVVNGDVFTDYPFSRLIQDLPAQGDLAHLVMVPNPPQHPEGDFALSQGRLSREGQSRLTFSGIGVYRPELLAGEHPLRFPLAPLLIEAMTQGKVSGEQFDGVWNDIGTPQRLAALTESLQGASAMLREGAAR